MLSKFIGICLLLSCSLFGASVVIYNDSPFPLSATILSADGKKKGTLTVTPQHQATWTDPAPPNEIFSQTPYTVIFKCKNGKQFGSMTGIAQGGWVTPMQSQGSRVCEVDDDKQQDQSQQQPQPVSPDQQPDLNLGPP